MMMSCRVGGVTWGAVVGLDLAKPVVGQFVHEAVEQSLGAARVHSELTLRGEVVRLLQQEGVWHQACNHRNRLHPP